MPPCLTRGRIDRIVEVVGLEDGSTLVGCELEEDDGEEMGSLTSLDRPLTCNYPISSR